MNQDLLPDYGEIEEKLVDLMDKAKLDPSIDQRNLALARTNFEQARMWLVKSVYNHDHSGWSRK